MKSLGGNLKYKFSVFHITCQSINAHWDELYDLIYYLNIKQLNVDIIGLTEVFQMHENINYDLDGYNPIEYKTRIEGRGRVAMYINDSLNYKVQNDLSVFIRHVIESIYIEIINSNNEVKILSQADIDIFLEGKKNNLI